MQIHIQKTEFKLFNDIYVINMSFLQLCAQSHPTAVCVITGHDLPPPVPVEEHFTNYTICVFVVFILISCMVTL